MKLIIDPDVKAVAEFMQGNMSASKLVSVASAIAALAPILWGRFEPEGIAALQLQHVNGPGAARTQPGAISQVSSAGADDGFAAAVS